jgi:hypothetical protein
MAFEHRVSLGIELAIDWEAISGKPAHGEQVDCKSSLFLLMSFLLVGILLVIHARIPSLPGSRDSGDTRANGLQRRYLVPPRSAWQGRRQCRSRPVGSFLAEVAVLAVVSAARCLRSIESFGSGPCRLYIVLPHEVVDKMNRRTEELR